MISAQAKERIERYITEAEDAGATVLVDGRGAVVPGKEDGYFIGPTIIDHVTPDMRIAQDEVFGPVLAIVRTKTVDEAIAVENDSPYGNASVAVRERGVGVHRERRRRASRDGARERGDGRRERRRAGAARAVLVRRLERVEVRRRRHHGPRVDRVLDAVEENDDEVESRGRNQLDELDSCAVLVAASCW